jgi:hypothetical protein
MRSPRPIRSRCWPPSPPPAALSEKPRFLPFIGGLFRERQGFKFCAVRTGESFVSVNHAQGASD